MGITRVLFKKIRDTKGTFHAKIGTSKDGNGMELTEAEDIKKRWQETTEELYKKHLHDPDNHNDMITHLEPDILKCKVKWALGSITTNKPSGGDEILVELFQIVKDDAVKVLHSICQQIWKTQQWSQDWKRSVFIPISKNAQTTAQLHSSHIRSRRRQWQSTPVLLPGRSHGRRSLMGCSSWGHYKWDMTKRLHFHFSLSCIGEGNGNPLQCSCLENPRDGGAWWAAVSRVAQSRTRLKRLSSSSSSSTC